MHSLIFLGVDNTKLHAFFDGKVPVIEDAHSMEEAISNAPVVDTAKVDEIKQAMSEGRFKVNTEKVADGLIESVRQMLSAQQVGQA